MLSAVAALALATTATAAPSLPVAIYSKDFVADEDLSNWTYTGPSVRACVRARFAGWA